MLTTLENEKEEITEQSEIGRRTTRPCHVQLHILSTGGIITTMIASAFTTVILAIKRYGHTDSKKSVKHHKSRASGHTITAGERSPQHHVG